ncbi:Mini-ribonuclease 3 [bioreactor metagenome]|uniref:Mini-ribonuclease 3 n=1 Tax=bioreactor metagenome TaxID=1076179 RepID=A0A645EPF6_9ZZZZ|nr:ribonuclease III domain-containing protein [Christensenella sp.]
MAMIDEIRRATQSNACANPRQLSPLALAQIGDTVCDLYARVYLNDQFARSPHELHIAASKYVCAAGQAAAYRRMEPHLTEDENAVFRRGRNAHSGTMPKNATAADYHTATGLEALFGWLFLSGEDARLNELMTIYFQPETKQIP